MRKSFYEGMSVENIMLRLNAIRENAYCCKSHRTGLERELKRRVTDGVLIVW